MNMETLDDPREIHIYQDGMHIGITQTPIEGNYGGTSRDQDYYKTNIGDTDMFTMKLSLEYMYDKQNPDEHLEKQKTGAKVNKLTGR